ncbi:hypothetical protein Tco_0598205 [Tanacetum coccineum]
MKDLRSSGKRLGKEVVVEPVNDDKYIDVNDEASDDDFVDMGGNNKFASGLRRSGSNKDKEVYDLHHAKIVASGSKDNNNLLTKGIDLEFWVQQVVLEQIPVLESGKFEQWKFRIQQYLQNEHYALWEVIEFGDSYNAPPKEAGKTSKTSSAKKKGRTIDVTTEDMQKRKNDAILKTYGGNEATKRTKKNQLRQQYGNFKASKSKSLEQTFNRLQAIVSHLEFLDVPIEQDDLNQKFLLSLSSEWSVHTIVWRNKDDLDSMSLDDLYNHLKVYEPKVQKNGGLSSSNMAFISSSRKSSGKKDVHTASVITSGVSTASTNNV